MRQVLRKVNMATKLPDTFLERLLASKEAYGFNLPQLQTTNLRATRANLPRRNSFPPRMSVRRVAKGKGRWHTVTDNRKRSLRYHMETKGSSMKCNYCRKRIWFLWQDFVPYLAGINFHKVKCYSTWLKGLVWNGDWRCFSSHSS